MQVLQILKEKADDGVVTVMPGSTVEQAMKLLASRRIGAVVVSPDGKAVAGIVSERDIVRALRSDGLPALRESRLIHLDRVTVGDIMTAEVTTCAPSTSIDEVMTLMTTGRIRHVPVTAEDSLVGIVSIGDIVKARISHLEWERSALVDYVTTGR